MLKPRIDSQFQKYCRRGDVAALGVVFDLAAPEMLRVARGFTRGDEAMGEDAVQSAFLAAMEKADRFDSSGRVMPWLLGLLAVELRRERSSAGRTPHPAWLAEGAELRSPTDPASIARDTELRALIETEVEALPASYRDAVRAHLFTGQSASQTAAGLGISAGALHVRVHRGLGLLRDALPAGAALGAGLMVGEPKGLTSIKAAVLAKSGAASGSLVAGTGWTLGSLSASKGALVAAAAAGLALGGGGVAAFQMSSPASEGGAPSYARAAGPAQASSPNRLDGALTLPVASEGPATRRAASVELGESTTPSSEQPFSSTAAANSLDLEPWLRLYREADGYTAIASAGLQLMELPEEQALEVATRVYPQLSQAQRKQFAKPFIFQAGASYGLDVVHLVATDVDESVRSFAWSFLKPFAYRDFSEDPSEYSAWRAATSHLSKREVLLEGAQDMVDRAARSGEPAAVFSAAQPPTANVLVGAGIEPRELLEDSSFQSLLPQWLSGGSAETARAALEWMALSAADESSYRTLVAPLLGPSNGPLRFHAAIALASCEEPWAAALLSDALALEAAPTDDQRTSTEFWKDWAMSQL